MEYWLPVIALFGTFFFLLAFGVPIVYAIGLSTLASVSCQLPFLAGLSVVSQKMISGLDSFTLLAIPFFILSGNIMNRGGIARRLIGLAKVLGSRLPGPLMHCNIVANMLFGAISGSAVAAAAAMGGIMHPLEKEEGYDPALSTAVNIASAPTGLLIPPSNTLIVYSLVSGGTSVAALFLAGYVPGIMLGVGLMILTGFLAKRKGLVRSPSPSKSEVCTAFLDAIPSIFLVVVIMGSILGGICTPTEASALAVVYTLLLAMVLYREVTITDLWGILLESVIVTSIVLLLVGASMGMSWAMANADVPFLISDLLLSVSDNYYVIMAIITVVLLIVGTFMDITPAVLIFTPIFLPIVESYGMSAVHFGIVMVFNLCIGICTPPVGSVLFVGCSIANIGIDKVIRSLLPLFAVMIAVLLLVTYIPALSLTLPTALGY